MIYVISRKFLDKQGSKLAAPKEYIIIDGENFGNNASGNDDPASQKYNKCYIRTGFCPERETISLLRRKRDGKDYSEKKLKNQLKEFFKGVDFLEAAFYSMKAQGIYGIDNDINVYVCLPNIVFKAIGKETASMIQELSGMDFQFVYTEKIIKDTKRKCLEKGLKKKQLKKINKAVKKAESKFKIKRRDDEDDDW